MLCGASGCGKTTVTRLINGLIPHYCEGELSGSVNVCGVDIKNTPIEKISEQVGSIFQNPRSQFFCVELDQKKIMERVSFVFQDSRLLKTSIFNNVRLARPDADEEEVTAALKAAKCEDIIDKLPKGIHTVVGDKGVYLSGGEQQRISIARAILKNAPILILDEATAFADPDNETKVQNAIAELANGKTVIMIAHRLSTVKNCDCIYVMKDGAVCESGTHQELMSKNGQYKSMYEEYSRSVNWKVGA